MCTYVDKKSVIICRARLRFYVSVCTYSFVFFFSLFILFYFIFNKFNGFRKLKYEQKYQTCSLCHFFSSHLLLPLVSSYDDDNVMLLLISSSVFVWVFITLMKIEREKMTRSQSFIRCFCAVKQLIDLKIDVTPSC